MRLLDHFIPIFVYNSQLLQDPQNPAFSFQIVADRFGRLLQEAISSCVRSGIPEPKYRSALFAVIAWVDESIHYSPWPDKARWRPHSLQRQHFNTDNAGVEFFDWFCRLDKTEKDLIEVYFYCLAMGFKGKYVHPEHKSQLDELISSHLKAVTDFPDRNFPQQLFPEALAGLSSGNVGPIKIKRFSRTWLMLLAAPLALFALLFLIYNLILNSALSVEQFLK